MRVRAVAPEVVTTLTFPRWLGEGKLAEAHPEVSKLRREPTNGDLWGRSWAGNPRTPLSNGLQNLPTIRTRGFNGLVPREWASLSRNVIRGVSPPRDLSSRTHGATFPVPLAERVVRVYSAEGDLVVDPFLGTGTTLVAARRWNRRGTGIELSSRFCRIARGKLGQRSLIDEWGYPPNVINDDCRNIRRHVADNSTRLVLTSPPYANFIRRSIGDRERTHKQSVLVEQNGSAVKPYSENPLDFGNLTYDAFLRQLAPLMRDLFTITIPGGYNVWVVKDYRDPSSHRSYVDFHSDIAHIGEKMGFRYHDLIVWDQNEDRSLIVLGYPTVFYANQNCSFLVVLRKPPTRPTSPA